MESKRFNRKGLGSAGEDAAVEYLASMNFQILARNFRVGRLGEIDIIAREGEYICFIEVKTRSSTYFGMPSEAVVRRKQENIRRLAWAFLKQHGLTGENVRFDVVEVLSEGKGLQGKISINLIRNAF